jgi:hypothetical protein
MTDTAEAPTCSKCGENPPGPGGILCPDCLAAIAAQRLVE